MLFVFNFKYGVGSLFSGTKIGIETYLRTRGYNPIATRHIYDVKRRVEAARKAKTVCKVSEFEDLMGDDGFKKRLEGHNFVQNNTMDG